MLCDDLMNAKWHGYEWLKGQRPTPEPLPFPDVAELSKQEIEQLSPEEVKSTLRKLEANVEVMERNAKRHDERQALFRSVNGRDAFCVVGHGMSEAELPELRTKLQAAHKFVITDTFRSATLGRLATPVTVLKAKELFRLTHNPMWLEWRMSNSEMGGNEKWGTLLYQPPEAGSEVFGYSVLAIEHGWCSVGSYRFDPSSLRFEGDVLAIDVQCTDAGQAEDTVEQNGSKEAFALQVTDFVIRINSPRITEVSLCDDLSAINKKRTRNGKLPLFSYHVVDLNRQVKAGLKAIEHEGADENEQGRRRRHWRRGHFKCCRTGIFWWNPHLAGRTELGVVLKEYAA